MTVQSKVLNDLSMQFHSHAYCGRICLSTTEPQIPGILYSKQNDSHWPEAVDSKEAAIHSLFFSPTLSSSLDWLPKSFCIFLIITYKIT